MSTTILTTLAVIVFLLYVMRRNARLKGESDDEY